MIRLHYKPRRVRYIPASAQEYVKLAYACPHCHERRLDKLTWTEGDTVCCQSCKTTYHVPEEE